MSGKKITDHSFFGGSGSPRFPVGNKTKDESSAEGVGALNKYEDTTESIKSMQMTNKAKVNGHPMKSGYRY